MGFMVVVQFGREAHEVELEDSACVEELQAVVEAKVGVIARNQKLIHKGKVLQAGQRLKDARVKDKTKIMLLASAGVESRGQTVAKVSNKERSEAARARAEKVIAQMSRTQGKSSGSAQHCSLEEQAKIWEKLKLVSLRDRKLTAVPEQALALGTTIEAVDISVNKIQELPDGFRNLERLRILRASQNCVTGCGLGKGIFALTTLVQLHLSGNYIESIPDDIGNLANLRTLSLAQNTLEVLPDGVCNLVSLSMLDISQNRIQELPRGLGKCWSLVELNAKKNVIAAIPAEFAGLQQLKMFNLDTNRIREVPCVILKECISLSLLSLHDNPITMEQLREVDGFKDYDARRRQMYDKIIDMDVLQDQGFDEGADFVAWEK